MSLSAEAFAQTAKATFEVSQLVSGAERTRALLEIRKELEANKDAIILLLFQGPMAKTRIQFTARERETEKYC
jgi:hypothetical protein